MLKCIFATHICNILFLFQYLNLVFMTKQRYSHIKKRLFIWINGTVSRSLNLLSENERCIRHSRAVDHVIITTLRFSSVANTDGRFKQTDIHLFRQIYSELYDMTFLINDTYGIPIFDNYVLDINRGYDIFI